MIEKIQFSQLENVSLQNNASPAKVRTIDSNGNAVITTREDLAAVVGGLLDIDDTWFRYRGLCTDANLSVKTGFYAIASTTTNLPSNTLSVRHIMDCQFQ